MKVHYYIFVLLISIQTGFSQTHIYQHFGVDEGLPSSEVYDVYQDKQGFVWFATDKGLSRYNGYEFENFTTKNGLPGNTVLDFYPQKDGRVYGYEYHSQSLFYFDENFDGFKPYKHNDVLKKQLKPNSIIKSMGFDENETLYVGGLGVFGLIKISKNGIVEKQFNKEGESKKYVSGDCSLGSKINNDVFFIMYNDYNSDENTLIFKLQYAPYSRVDLIRLNQNQSVFIDQKLGLASKNGKVKYYKTEQYPIGLKRIDNDSFFVGYYGNGAEIRNVSGDILNTFLPNKSVSDFLIDTEGSYWFTTIDDGVFYVKNPKIKVFTKKHISSLVKDHTHTLYTGFSDGSIARISNNKFDILSKGINKEAALVAFNAIEKAIYGFNHNYLVNYSTKNKSFIVGANSLPEHIGEPLLSSSVHNINIKNKDSVVSYRLNNKIQDVCMYQNEVLIGTSSGLFTLKDKKAKKHQPVAILKSRIDDIDLNKNTNTVYMATQGNGVIVYGDSIYNITKNNGLTNDIVSEVYIENDSIVWACTNSGLNRIVFKSNKTFNLSTLTKADGLLSNDIDDIEIVKDTLWVATKKGLCFFNKNLLIEKEASKIISLSLDDVTVNRNSVYGKNVKLKYNQNNISFKLQAISHKNTNKINYSYRLKEIDASWTSTTSRKIHFPSLSPGAYTFQAKANVYNNENDYLITYAFKILPPFWKRWWFYGIYIALLFGLTYVFFKIRVLTYNKDVIRELIRLAIKRLKRKDQFYNFRSNGEDFKIPTHEILYINSQGNYLDIVTQNKTYTIRCKIGDFITTTSDALEYLRIHRSYIIRIDQVSSKGKNWVVIKDQKIPVGETYLNELGKINF